MQNAAPNEMAVPAEAQAAVPEKLIYVLPRIRLSGSGFQQKIFCISKATFLPDEPKSWDEQIQCPRPEWLDIFRQFPYPSAEDTPEPARGTLIFSDDNEWLGKHISKLIGVAYFLGLDESRWEIPADAFQYSFFPLRAAGNNLVTLNTKTRSLTENLGSIQLLPPLELRAAPDSMRLNLEDAKHVELIRRFTSNPYDRLAVACYHLFRSQFDNPVMAPVEQDFAAYCACLEAALDVTGPDYSKELCDKLTGIYGKHSAMEVWMKGLYSERSVFNHGIAAEPTLTSPDPRLRALAEFRQIPHNRKVLRRLCLDVIKEQIQESLESAKRELSRLLSSTRKMLERFFFSDEVWGEVVKVSTQSKSVDTIRSYAGGDKDEFIELCCRFLNDHKWQDMKGNVEQKKIYAVLKTMAALFGEEGKTANNQEDIASAGTLYKAADGEDNEAVSAWARNHTHWVNLPPQGVGSVAKAVSAHTAMFFRVHK